MRWGGVRVTRRSVILIGRGNVAREALGRRGESESARSFSKQVEEERERERARESRIVKIQFRAVSALGRERTLNARTFETPKNVVPARDW